VLAISAEIIVAATGIRSPRLKPCVTILVLDGGAIEHTSSVDRDLVPTASAITPIRPNGADLETNNARP
jgi:hypothetical protein